MKTVFRIAAVVCAFTSLVFLYACTPATCPSCFSTTTNTNTGDITRARQIASHTQAEQQIYSPQTITENATK